MRGQPPGKNRLQQIHDPHRSNIRLGGFGIVPRDGFNVIAADRDRPLRSELLVDLVNADLPQFVSGLVSMKAERTKISIHLVEGLVRHVKTRQPAVVIELLPNRVVDRSKHAPPG